MVDLIHAYHLAQAATNSGNPAAPALVNALAEAILDLPENAAVVQMSFFPAACELAGFAKETIARLNPPKPEKLWAGFNVYGH